jgi:hypothetical protein
MPAWRVVRLHMDSCHCLPERLCRKLGPVCVAGPEMPRYPVYNRDITQRPHVHCVHTRTDGPEPGALAPGSGPCCLCILFREVPMPGLSWPGHGLGSYPNPTASSEAMECPRSVGDNFWLKWPRPSPTTQSVYSVKGSAVQCSAVQCVCRANCRL